MALITSVGCNGVDGPVWVRYFTKSVNQYDEDVEELAESFPGYIAGSFEELDIPDEISEYIVQLPDQEIIDLYELYQQDQDIINSFINGGGPVPNVPYINAVVEHVNTYEQGEQVNRENAAQVRAAAARYAINPYPPYPPQLNNCPINIRRLHGFAVADGAAGADEAAAGAGAWLEIRLYKAQYRVAAPAAEQALYPPVEN